MIRWTITELRANNTRNMEFEYLRMRRHNEHDPVPVEFNNQIVTELYVSTLILLLLHDSLQPLFILNHAYIHWPEPV